MRRRSTRVHLFARLGALAVPIVVALLTVSAAPDGQPQTVAHAQDLPTATPTSTSAAPSDASVPGSPLPPGAPLATSAPAPSPTSTGPDLCYGDELMTYTPESPRVGNELLIAVSSAYHHPYPRLAGTERTTFVRERPGQLGTVWEWSVSPTWVGQHSYTFYVDTTIPCKELSLRVREQLGLSSSSSGDNSSSDNDSGDNDSGNAIVIVVTVTPAPTPTPTPTAVGP